MSERKVEDACGYPLYRSSAIKAIKANPDGGHARLALAFIEARGCRLTWDQVFSLVQCDDAIASACYDILKDHDPEETQ